jgi:hypothetical protein
MLQPPIAYPDIRPIDRSREEMVSSLGMIIGGITVSVGNSTVSAEAVSTHNRHQPKRSSFQGE